MIDTADVVLHTPTGERWVVAFVQGDRLSWCGWPEGTANLADCTLVEKATPEKRLELLRQMADMHNQDSRCRFARNALKPVEYSSSPQITPFCTAEAHAKLARHEFRGAIGGCEKADVNSQKFEPVGSEVKPRTGDKS